VTTQVDPEPTAQRLPNQSFKRIEAAAHIGATKMSLQPPHRMIEVNVGVAGAGFFNL